MKQGYFVLGGFVSVLFIFLAKSWHLGILTCVWDFMWEDQRFYFFIFLTVFTHEKLQRSLSVLCVSIHRHISRISVHHIWHFSWCLYKSLSGWWALIPGCRLLSSPFALHPRLYFYPLFSFFSLSHPFPFFNVFFADSLLAFIGPNSVTKHFTNN